MRHDDFIALNLRPILYPAGSAAEAIDPTALASMLHAVESGVASGFQLAAAAGPLCDEPMWGVAFEVQLSAAQNVIWHTSIQSTQADS